jgi:hypothetical protein
MSRSARRDRARVASKVVPRVYMRVQGTMANVTVGPVYNTDRASLQLVRQMGLGPHIAGYDQLPGGVRRPGGVPFETTPVRVLTPKTRHASTPVEVCPLRGGVTGIGPLTDAVMGSVDQAAVLSDIQWRTDLGAACVQGVLTRFRGLADTLGHQMGVPMEGVDDPFHLGQATLFVNRPTRWSADPDCEDDDDNDVPDLVPAIPGGIGIHIDETLVSDAKC